MTFSVVPIMMCKNEELWIDKALAPLCTCFQHVIVADTGSTDNTLYKVHQFSNVVLRELGPLDARELGQVRAQMQAIARELGYGYIMVVDADEIYNVATLRDMQEKGIPFDGCLGFTAMLSLDMDDATGQIWELADNFSRLCINPSDMEWQGDYPFESPKGFTRTPDRYYYFVPPQGYRYHAVHIHRFQRSLQDAAVMWRLQKQKQFSLQDVTIPRTVLFDMQQWTTCG